MLHTYRGETWKELVFKDGFTPKKNYAISNHGRLVSYYENTVNALELKGSLVEGYKSIGFKVIKNGKPVYKTYLFHKLIGEYFLEKLSEKHIYVIYLDYDKQNLHVSNLKWATQEEMKAHQYKNPAVLQGRIKKIETKKSFGFGTLLTSTKALRLKKRINDPNRKTRLRLIEKEFGISEMQLCRIKRGENWGHINPIEKK